MLAHSQAWPDAIPAEFTTIDTLADAYRRGWSHGHGIACHNVPRIGATYWLVAEARMTCDADNTAELHEMLCHAAADHSRCFSPFECTASEFNRCGDGGFRICFDHDDRSEEVYATREEAEGAAEAEGWGGTDIEEVPSSEACWEAFERGTADAIGADLRGYDLNDYGAGESAS